MAHVWGQSSSTDYKVAERSSVRVMHTYRLPAVDATYPPHRDDDPLINQPEPIFDGDESLETAADGEMVPYAHRDIKPAQVATFAETDCTEHCRNIMIADDGSAILMDFGSTIK